MKHHVRYLKGTTERGLCFRISSVKLGIKAYSDANWTDDVSHRRSTTGYRVSLSKDSSLVSWKTKKTLLSAANSTCEAEYIAFASTIQECLYLQNLMENIHTTYCALCTREHLPLPKFLTEAEA